MTPHQQDDEPEDDAQREGEPPADVLGEEGGVQGEYGEQGAGHGAEPETAVDDEVDAAPVLTGDQFVDGRVDRRVLPTDPEAGEEAEEENHQAEKEIAVSAVAAR